MHENGDNQMNSVHVGHCRVYPTDFGHDGIGIKRWSKIWRIKLAEKQSFGGGDGDNNNDHEWKPMTFFYFHCLISLFNFIV